MELQQQFQTFSEVEQAVAAFCSNNYHPVRIDHKVQVGSANRKVAEQSRITGLQDSDIYACRLASVVMSVATTHNECGCRLVLGQ